VVACLLKQVAHPLDALHPCLESICGKVKYGSSKPVLSDLVDLFVTCSRHFSAVLVILDAFDECGQQSSIIGVLKQFYLSGIKVYITLRPHILDTFKNEFDGAAVMEITADGDDVKNYITSKLKAKKRLTDDFKAEIIQEIGSRAQGM
jgi:hypothetical protein